MDDQTPYWLCTTCRCRLPDGDAACPRCGSHEALGVGMHLTRGGIRIHGKLRTYETPSADDAD